MAERLHFFGLWFRRLNYTSPIFLLYFLQKRRVRNNIRMITYTLLNFSFKKKNYPKQFFEWAQISLFFLFPEVLDSSFAMWSEGNGWVGKVINKVTQKHSKFIAENIFIWLHLKKYWQEQKWSENANIFIEQIFSVQATEIWSKNTTIIS